MPAKTKYDWSHLLDTVRKLWHDLGREPSVHAVSKAAGGGGTTRIQHAITAVGIEHGHNVSLYPKLPEDLQKLILDPRKRPDALPEVDCSPALATVVRDAMKQIAAACATSERHAHAEAERRVANAEARMAAELEAMYQRLQDGAAAAEAEARAHSEVAADYERRLGETTAALAVAREEIVSRVRELHHAVGEVETARSSEREARARWEQALEQQRGESARYAADLAAVTERALRAEAERDASRQTAERLTGELSRACAAAESTAARNEADTSGLRTELVAARQALHDEEQRRAVAEALLAAVRVGRESPASVQ